MHRPRPKHEIVFVGCYDDGFLVHVVPVAENLIADLTDVLEGGTGSSSVEDQNVGRRLPESAKGMRILSTVGALLAGRGHGSSSRTAADAATAAAAVQFPLGQRIFWKFVHSRKVGDVQLDDAVVGEQAGSIADRSVGRADVFVEFIVDEPLSYSKQEKKGKKHEKRSPPVNEQLTGVYPVSQSV